MLRLGTVSFRHSASSLASTGAPRPAQVIIDTEFAFASAYKFLHYEIWRKKVLHIEPVVYNWD